MKLLFVTLCLSGLVLGCLAVPARVQVPPPPPPPGITPAAVMASSPEEAGTAAVSLWEKRYPGLLRGRVALGWDARVPATAAAAKGMALADAALLSLPSLGVSVESLAQALDQVDPKTFSGVLWLEVRSGQGGELTGLTLAHRATGTALETRLDVVLDPPIAPPSTSDVSPPATPAETLLNLEGTVCGAALSEGGEEMWVASPGRLVRRSLVRGETLQEWTTAEGESPATPCLLRLVTKGEGPEKVGWCAGGRGAWFALQGEEFRRGTPFEGFPLTERETKFLSAPWLSEEGAFALQDHQGKDLGRFVGLVRARAEGGESLLVLMGRDGSLRSLHGNSLEPLPPPSEGTFSAFAGWRDLVAVAELSAPYRIRAFRAGEGGRWEEVWTSGPLPKMASALCVGSFRGRISVLAFVGEGDRVAVLLLSVGGV